MVRNNKNKNRSSDLIRWYYNQTNGLDVDEKLQAKFTRWVTDDTNSEQKNRILEELYAAENGDSDNQTNRQAIEKILAEFEKRGGFTQTRKAKKVRLSPLQISMRVAAVIAPLLVVTGGWLYFEAHRYSEMSASWSVPSGQTREVALADSSKVWINSGSELTVNQDDDQRVAQLKGESYFKVSKDENRKFTVKTRDLTVTVLGTEFDIEAYPNQILTIVTLERGKVTLTGNDNREWKLESNQRFIYNNETGEGRIINIDPQEATGCSAWIKGAVVYKEKTVIEVLNMVESKYGYQIEISPDLEIDQKSYMIGIKADDTAEEIIRLLQLLTEEFNYTIENKKITIFKQ